MGEKKQGSEDGKVKGILKRGDEKSIDDRFECCCRVGGNTDV